MYLLQRAAEVTDQYLETPLCQVQDIVYSLLVHNHSMIPISLKFVFWTCIKQEFCYKWKFDCDSLRFIFVIVCAKLKQRTNERKNLSIYFFFF